MPIIMLSGGCWLKLTEYHVFATLIAKNFKGNS